jgi:hypothetical protein
MPSEMSLNTRKMIAAGMVMLGVAVMGGIVMLRSPNSAKPAKSRTISEAEAMDRYAHLPVYFERNDGQTDPSVRYLTHQGRYSMFLTDQGTVFSIVGGELSPSHTPMGAVTAKSDDSQHQLVESAVRVRMVGASSNARFEGIDPLPGRVNYLIGNDPSKFHRDIPTFGRVKIAGVYPGIDLIYYGTRDSIEYDIVAAPGADVSKVKLSVEGPTQTTLDENGNLLISAVAGGIVMRKPVIYQEAANGARTKVEGSFVLAKDGTIEAGVHKREISLALADYDRTRPIIIDPTVELVYSTFLGGGSPVASNQNYGPVQLEQFSFLTDNSPLRVADVGTDVAVDIFNKAYLTGVVYSLNFPHKSFFQGSLQDSVHAQPNKNPNFFVAKFNYATTGAASLRYSTYVGGSGNTNDAAAGKGDGDLAFGIAVDASQQAYVVGQTYSEDFPLASTRCGSFGQTIIHKGKATNNGFVVKLNALGNDLVHSCYITGFYNATEARVALYPSNCGDGNGQTACQAYVVGSTQSNQPGPSPSPDTSFPVTAGAFQSTNKGSNGKSNATFLVVHPDFSSLDYATLFGGAGNGENSESGLGIGVRSNGDAYITGATYSQPPSGGGTFTLRHPAFSTYLGAGNATSNVFVAEFNPNANGDTSLLYSTYLGGSGASVSIPIPFSDPAVVAIGDIGTAIKVDNSTGDVWVAGVTASTNFRKIPGNQGVSYQTTNRAAANSGPPATAAFLMQLTGNHSTLLGNQVLYSTYFSGFGHKYTISVPFEPDAFIGVGDGASDMVFKGGKLYMTGLANSGSKLGTGQFPLSANACYNRNKTTGFDFGQSPVSLKIPETAWVAELDPSQASAGAELLFSTFLGGSGTADIGGGIRVDSTGKIVVGGLTYSKDFPVTPFAFQGVNRALAEKGTNAFLTVIDPTGDTCPTPTATATRTATPTATATP